MRAAVRHLNLGRVPLRVGACALAFLLGSGLPTDRSARAATDPELGIKVAMVYNIARFVEWPAARRPAAGSLLRLGVAGDEQLLTAFLTLAGKTVGDASIEVVPIHSNADLLSCHLVYFATAGRAQVTNVADATLTVSDVEGFSRSGGMVELVRERNKIRFLVNPAVARAHGLQFSSQLLKLATIVEDD
jgi:hypothetical protein